MIVGESAGPGPEQRAVAANAGRAPVTAVQLIAVGVPSFFLGVIGSLVVWAATRSAPEVPVQGSGAAGVTGAVAASGAPAAGGTAGDVRMGSSHEAETRKALARFRDGIGACVRDVIGVLPGTSPPVPITMKLMKNGMYTSVPPDWRTPVYACASYSEASPQPYQIQWQNGAAPAEGLGVAWLDDDGDGEPDRAFGFTAKLVRKKEVTFGEIVPLTPMPKVLPGR